MPPKEKMKIYEAVLSSPGMEDNVKIDFRISRKNILLISRIIEHGLSVDENKDEIFVQLPNENTEEIQKVREEMLRKGKLNEFDIKLKALSLYIYFAISVNGKYLLLVNTYRIATKIKAKLFPKL